MAIPASYLYGLLGMSPGPSPQMYNPMPMGFGMDPTWSQIQSWYPGGNIAGMLNANSPTLGMTGFTPSPPGALTPTPGTTQPRAPSIYDQFQDYNGPRPPDVSDGFSDPRWYRSPIVRGF